MYKIETRLWEEVLRSRHPIEAKQSPALLKTAARLIAMSKFKRQQVKAAPKTLSQRIKLAIKLLLGGE
jgi:hypothetical protein